MAEVTLKAEVRDGRGKGAARKLRAGGMIPAVLYGRGGDPVALTVPVRDLNHTLATDAGMNVLIDLQIDGRSELAMPRVLDRDPVRGDIRHIDFLRINRDQTVAVDVTIHLEGDARGVREGGMLDQHTYQLHIEALPGSLPERMDVDVSELGIGDVIRIGDVKAPEGVTILSPEDEIVVSCIVAAELPTEPELEEGAVEVEGAEPEEGAAAAAEGESTPES